MVRGKQMLKKRDVIFIIIVILLAGIMAVFMYPKHGEKGEMVRIMIDGKEHGSYLLGEDRVIEISNNSGYNKIVIENGVVYMEKADCPDQYCVEHKAISKENEAIVCLPHKLVVEMHSQGKKAVFDGVTQ